MKYVSFILIARLSDCIFFVVSIWYKLAYCLVLYCFLLGMEGVVFMVLSVFWTVGLVVWYSHQVWKTSAIHFSNISSAYLPFLFLWDSTDMCVRLFYIILWHSLQYTWLENPTDGGAWWATVHGVAKSQTQLSDFIFTFIALRCPVFFPYFFPLCSNLVNFYWPTFKFSDFLPQLC